MKVELERPVENEGARKPVANRRSGRGAIPKNSSVVNVGGVDSTDQQELEIYEADNSRVRG